MPLVEPELLTAEDRAVLRCVAESLWGHHTQIADEWARRLIARTPDLNALHALVAGLNDQLLQVVLTHCRNADFDGLYTAYYERMYELVEADMQVGHFSERSLETLHASARISLLVIGEQPQMSARMMSAYTKLGVNLMLLADQAHAKCHQAFFERAQAFAAASDERKDAFVATLAHELRNPLGAIRNAVAVLQREGPQEGFVSQAVSIMDRQLTHVTQLVNDLYDFSRVTHGKVEFQHKVVDLATIVTTAAEASRPLIDARRQRLTVSLPERPVGFDADPIRLVQIISNLLSNSAKYTEEGGHISLVAERERADVRITVRDTGIGIPAEMLPRIFDPFVQVAGEKRDGLGIGLMLARTLVEMHGGTITAASEGVGKGSQFVVRLPIDRP